MRFNIEVSTAFGGRISASPARTAHIEGRAVADGGGPDHGGAAGADGGVGRGGDGGVVGLVVGDVDLAAALGTGGTGDAVADGLGADIGVIAADARIGRGRLDPAGVQLSVVQRQIDVGVAGDH